MTPTGPLSRQQRRAAERDRAKAARPRRTTSLSVPSPYGPRGARRARHQVPAPAPLPPERVTRLRATSRPRQQPEVAPHRDGRYGQDLLIGLGQYSLGEHGQRDFHRHVYAGTVPDVVRRDRRAAGKAARAARRVTRRAH